MATEAVLVVRSCVADQWPVGIMAGNADDARITVGSPAVAGLKTIRGESDGKNAVHVGLNDVKGGPMAGAAKVHRIRSIQRSRIQSET